MFAISSGRIFANEKSPKVREGERESEIGRSGDIESRGTSAANLSLLKYILFAVSFSSRVVAARESEHPRGELTEKHLPIDCRDRSRRAASRGWKRILSRSSSSTLFRPERIDQKISEIINIILWSWLYRFGVNESDETCLTRSDMERECIVLSILQSMLNILIGTLKHTKSGRPFWYFLLSAVGDGLWDCDNYLMRIESENEWEIEWQQ